MSHSRSVLVHLEISEKPCRVPSCDRLCVSLAQRVNSEELLTGPVGMSTVLRTSLQKLTHSMGGEPLTVHQRTAALYQDSLLAELHGV